MNEELLKKLVDQTITEKELRVLLAELCSDGDTSNSAMFSYLWNNLPKQSRDEDQSQRILKQVLQRIEDDNSCQRKVGPINRRAKVMSMALRWSAVAACVMLISLFSFWLTSPENPGIESISTHFGEQKTFSLADGSKIALNANSNLIYADWSPDQSRDVWLQGEAYFEVEKNPVKPQTFKVVTDHLTIEVLGTTFNVQTRGSRTSVYLKEGSIRLNLKQRDSSIMMEAGDLVVFVSTTNEIIHRSNVSAMLHTSWKDGVINFKDAPLKDVLERLHDLYGVDCITTRNMDTSISVNVHFPTNNLDLSISILEKMLTDIQFRLDADKLMIKPVSKDL